MANKILCTVLNILTVVLMVVVIISIRKSIEIQNDQSVKISVIDQKLK